MVTALLTIHQPTAASGTVKPAFPVERVPVNFHTLVARVAPVVPSFLVKAVVVLSVIV